MKAFYCFLIALFLFVSSCDNPLGAKVICSDFGTSFFAPNNAGIEKQKCLVVASKLFTPESSKKNSQKTKKRNRKGVKPLLFCVFNDYSDHTGVAAFDDILFKQISYSCFTFSGNGKRGPPFFSDCSSSKP